MRARLVLLSPLLSSSSSLPPLSEGYETDFELKSSYSLKSAAEAACFYNDLGLDVHFLVVAAVVVVVFAHTTAHHTQTQRQRNRACHGMRTTRTSPSPTWLQVRIPASAALACPAAGRCE